MTEPFGTPAPPLDGLLDRLSRVLADRKNPQGTYKKLLRWTGRLLAVATVAYALGLLALLAAMEWHGERHWLLSFLLFLPAQGWLLPLVALTPLCLLVRPRLVFIHLGCAVFVLWLYMGWRISFQREAKGPTVTLVTNNIGQNNRTSLAPFVAAEQPDIIALQEAAGNVAAWQREYTNRFVAMVDQFTLISRFPIKNSGLAPVRADKDWPVAAWFELDCDGKPLVIYSVHLPTPRNQLENVKGLGFLAALVGRDDRYGGKLRGYSRDFWDRQVKVAEELAAHFAKEQRPFLIAGDFNVPDHGAIYHTFAARFTDAFAARGRGYGFTFPGYTRNPLTLFGPWLRLDYIWSGESFRPIYCRAEPDRKSQHRAVAARFEWTDAVAKPERGK
ncbi:MAG: endonuclease/exonuclease/phosphatase family protein [Verrucomicrobia bacterium]|nr:endonuclease/exonuclease/phosphatase family protein [Verrucomicrobiota bacterium]